MSEGPDKKHDCKGKAGAYCTICGEDCLSGAQCGCDIFEGVERFCANCGGAIDDIVKEEDEKDLSQMGPIKPFCVSCCGGDCMKFEKCGNFKKELWESMAAKAKESNQEWVVLRVPNNCFFHVTSSASYEDVLLSLEK